MWTIIIAIIASIIVRFIYKFIVDTRKQSSDIKNQGGIRTKYATLVDHFLHANEQCRILREDNTFVAVGIKGLAGSQVYSIYPSYYGKVTIRMEIKNNPLFGNMKEEWTFPEDMNQEYMIMNINKKLEEIFLH